MNQCKDCKHWNASWLDSRQHALCEKGELVWEMIGGSPAGLGEAEVMTRESFGCVLWEPHNESR